jgi:MFS family permease
LGLLARLPYAMGPLGTLLLVQAATGSYGFAGTAAGAQSLATGGGGIAVGRAVERFGLRRLGALTAVLNATALVALIASATIGNRPLMLIVATLVGLCQAQVGALTRIHWSHRATNTPQLLPTALSYESAVDETSFIVGPAIVGLLATVAPSAPAAGGAVLLLSAALPLAARYAETPTQPGGDNPAKPPLPVAGLAAMALAMAFIGTIFGVLQTGVTAYAKHTGAPGTAGVLYAGLGVASALAGVAYAWLPASFEPRTRYRVFAAALLGGMLLLAFGAGMLTLPVAIVLTGATIAPYMISVYALTGQLAAGRIATGMTAVGAGGPIGTAAGQALAGALVDRHGYHSAFLLAPLVALLALLLACVRNPMARNRSEAPGHPELA